MEHNFTETYKVNFNKLKFRLLDANYDKKLAEELVNIKGSTLIVCTGGSKSVGYYLEMCINDFGLVKVIEPRDYFYMSEVKYYDNLVIVSNSMKSNGLENILDDFKGNKYIITGSNQNYNASVLRYVMNDNERSFISLANTLIPMMIILESFEKIDAKLIIADMLLMALELVNSIGYDFSNSNLIQIISGYDSRVTQTVLESNLVETGALGVVIHDKGSLCHGRSNLIYRNPDSPIIFLGNKLNYFDEFLKESLLNYNIIDLADIKYERSLINEFYKVIVMYYLSLNICISKNIDMCMPDYDKSVVRKLYNYRGVM